MDPIKDLLTGEKFIPKRINQRFVNAANRVKYYNNKANALRHRTAAINKPLHTNLLILNDLLADKKDTTFHKQYLLGKGYSFEVYNHMEEVQGTRYFAIYEYVLIPLENEQIKIIKK